MREGLRSSAASTDRAPPPLDPDQAEPPRGTRSTTQDPARGSRSCVRAALSYRQAVEEGGAGIPTMTMPRTAIPHRSASEAEAAQPGLRLEEAAIGRIKKSVRRSLASPNATNVAQGSLAKEGHQPSPTRPATSGATPARAAPTFSSPAATIAGGTPSTRGTTRQLLMDGFLAGMSRSSAAREAQAELGRDSKQRKADAEADGW